MSIKDIQWVIGFLQTRIKKNKDEIKIAEKNNDKELEEKYIKIVDDAKYFINLYEEEIRFYKKEMIKKLKV